MRHLSILALLLGFLSASCGLKTGPPVSATLDGYGILQVDPAVATRPANSGIASEYPNLSSRHTVINTTDLVAAKLGVTFGINFSLGGLPAGTPITTVIRIQHPPITNPATGRTVHVAEDTQQNRSGSSTYSAFIFENDWEIAPGPWTFQVFTNGQRILEKTFTVTDGRKN
ncbi:hypothetical protein BH09VER1_BH09VER1_05300 [soil metagenome]